MHCNVLTFYFTSVTVSAIIDIVSTTAYGLNSKINYGTGRSTVHTLVQTKAYNTLI